MELTSDPPLASAPCSDHRLLQPRQHRQHCGQRLQQAGDRGGGALHPRRAVCHPLPGEEEVGGANGSGRGHASDKGAPAAALPAGA